MEWIWLAWVFLSLLISHCHAFLDVKDLMHFPSFGDDLGLLHGIIGITERHNHLAVRALNFTTALTDNHVHDLQISPNSTFYFSFSPKDVIANNTGGGYSLYITMNTCTQPALNTSQANYTSMDVTAVPQLGLYVSSDPSNKLPGPLAPSAKQIYQSLSLGFANLTLTNVTETIYIGIDAPVFENLWMGGWTFELGLSSISPLHSVQAHQNIFLIDSDQTAALFTTGNLTLANNVSAPNFNFVVTTGALNFTIASLANSFCATRSNPTDLTQNNADQSITTRGDGGLPKAQYYLHGLGSNTTYSIYLTLPNVNTSIGGGSIYRAVKFQTKLDMNCQIVFNMSFCTEVAYAAPANMARLSLDQTAEFYDNLVSSLYKNFTYSLQTYQCQANIESIFSPLRTCDDCANAYKKWLCAVNIPRCEDATLNASYLRYIGGDVPSRQPLIDEVLQPGPYKEVLPCIGLCYGIVQNCPVSLQFLCPRQGTYGFDSSYGTPWDGIGEPVLKCNSPEQVYNVSGGRSDRGVSIGFMWVMTLSVLFTLYNGIL